VAFSDRLRNVVAFVGNIFARESLAEEPAAPRRPRRGFFAPETLPLDPPLPPPAPRPGILRALFAPESLETLPALPRTTRPTRWLRWLVGPEPLDPP
jgi:hypothetical protein